MNSGPIIEGTISGLVTALVWAILALGYNWIRNLWLRRRLRQAFKWGGRGRTLQGFTVSVTNRTSIPVTVRQVKLYRSYPTESIVLNFSHLGRDVIREPLKKIGDTQTDHYFVSPREIGIKQDNFGAPIGMAEINARGFVELPPHTDATWIVPNKVVRQFDWSLAACRLVLEYKTVFGNQAVIPVFLDKGSLAHMTRDYKKHREDLLNAPASGGTITSTR